MRAFFAHDFIKCNTTASFILAWRILILSPGTHIEMDTGMTKTILIALESAHWSRKGYIILWDFISFCEQILEIISNFDLWKSNFFYLSHEVFMR